MLVSTKCIDNGVDFKDRKLKHIICDIFDIESAIQCLGRKRVLDENDTCTFYIRDYKPYELNIFYRNVQDQLEPAELFEMNRTEWESKFGKNRQYKDYTIYYDFDIIKDYKLNPLRYSKLKDDEKNIKAMIDKKTSYRQKITDYLGPTVDGKSIETLEIKNDIIKDAIRIFLDLHMNERLDKEMQGKLVDTCKLEDRFHRPQSSIGQISKYLEENYGCEVKPDRKQINGKRIQYWVINKINGQKIK